MYSTCTLNRDENEDVCLWLKAQYPDAVEFLPLDDLFNAAKESATPEGFLHVFPQIYDCEGFFVARLRKNSRRSPVARAVVQGGEISVRPA
ncbi:rRNA (cytosine-C(5)-)-methyltransferase RsmF [Enterobacter cancerogenus]|uniref:rRNA (Cytosine-C(5)-)-methyltransferase RsmF n=1 Tax=Enterobacter cancerogenus TaxID=69218 RepID=A0A484W6B0_9ENTR|nr:rRNA (cytosine-C(5)-)-methyltransferase RsmF [Enterobacter cancerogenus]